MKVVLYVWRTILIVGLAGTTLGQQAGNWYKEVHPLLKTWQCTRAGGCKSKNTSLVMDEKGRWMHLTGTSTGSCAFKNWTLDRNYCVDSENCHNNCVYEGVNYAQRGVTTINKDADNSELQIALDYKKNKSARLYLLDESDTRYEQIVLKAGMELSFVADVGSVLCGALAAVYLVQMDPTGGTNQYNTAGARMGTGYCDAQCKTTPDFFNGTVNINHAGVCCSEFDFLEGDRYYSNTSPHTCKNFGPYACTTDTECAHSLYGGVCSHYGCNLYSGYPTDVYYGVNYPVNTLQPMTVITQFLSNSDLGLSAPTGADEPIVAVRKYYIQNGKLLVQAAPIINDATCYAEEVQGGRSGERLVGGFAQVTKTMALGMSLVISLFTFDTPTICTTGQDAGQGQHPPYDSYLSIANIKWGELNSTWSLTG